MKRKILSFHNVGVVMNGQVIIEELSFDIHESEHWVILGPNGSGKSTLVRALFGGVPVTAGTVNTALLKQEIGSVSFELLQKMLEQEHDAVPDQNLTARAIMLSAVPKLPPALREQRLMEMTHQFRLQGLLKKPFQVLSTGERRKMLIVRALMKNPKLLILDEPFDGLDPSARKTLKTLIEKLFHLNMTVILVTHRFEEISDAMSHAILIREGSAVAIGKRHDVLTEQNLKKTFDHKSDHESFDIVLDHHGQSLDPSIPLVDMRQVTVQYGKKIVLKDFHLKIMPGQHTAILGPNGSGKSTIVRMILGENPQAYANDIWLFGKKKGSGECVSEIKGKIGSVSDEFQLQYREEMSAFDVVLSGFFDSVGLYRKATEEQRKRVFALAKHLQMTELLNRPFRMLSYGQKRMVLLLRAMIKPPSLLIVDEPTHGLDMPNRKRILHVLQSVTKTGITLLMVTHHEDELVEGIVQVMVVGRKLLTKNLDTRSSRTL